MIAARVQKRGLLFLTPVEIKSSLHTHTHTHTEDTGSACFFFSYLISNVSFGEMAASDSATGERRRAPGCRTPISLIHRNWNDKQTSEGSGKREAGVRQPVKKQSLGCRTRPARLEWKASRGSGACWTRLVAEPQFSVGKGQDGVRQLENKSLFR